MTYKMNQINNLAKFADNAAANATTEADKARYEGQAEAFRFMLAQEMEAHAAAIYSGAASQHPEGSPEFVRAYNKAAAAQGLPLLVVVAA